MQPAADTIPALAASGRASSCAATAATAPVRSAVTARVSISASGWPFSSSDTQITPFTTGSPRAGFPGNDVTHLTIASPEPRAGIARKSPFATSR